MESDLLESDFDTAVSSHVYLFESRREGQSAKGLARRIAFELARILAPLWGGEVEDEEEELPQRTHEHVFVDGECDCGLQIKDGVTGYGLFEKEVEGYEIGDTGLKTKGSRRILNCAHAKVFKNPDGRRRCLECGVVVECQHKNFKSDGGELLCLDCGVRGN